MPSGRWPDAARADADGASRYVPLAHFSGQVPIGWDGVLARALAPRPGARFEALSEFQTALQQPLQAQPNTLLGAQRGKRPWRLLWLGLLLPLAIGLWLSVQG